MEATFVNKEMFQYQKQAYSEGCLWSKAAGKVNNIKAIKLYSGACCAPGIWTHCLVRTWSTTDFSGLWHRCSTGVAQVAECLSSLWDTKYLCFQVPHMGGAPAKQETEEQKPWSMKGTKNWMGFSTLFQSQWTHTPQTRHTRTDCDTSYNYLCPPSHMWQVCWSTQTKQTSPWKNNTLLLMILRGPSSRSNICLWDVG